MTQPSKNCWNRLHELTISHEPGPLFMETRVSCFWDPGFIGCETRVSAFQDPGLRNMKPGSYWVWRVGLRTMKGGCFCNGLHKSEREWTAKSNFFVKPDEQWWACSVIAMARKRRMKSNFLVLIYYTYTRARRVFTYRKERIRRWILSIKKVVICHALSCTLSAPAGFVHPSSPI